MPVPVFGLDTHTVVKIASNMEGGHFLAVMSDGRVFSWGAGDHGQLGVGDLRSVYALLLLQAVDFIDVLKLKQVGENV